MLEVKSVDLHYGAAQALRNVSLHAQVGEVTCVLGRNGVGKTSLLDALAGQQPVSNGSIIWEGQDITRLKPYERARRGIAYVPQGREIFLGGLGDGWHRRCRADGERLAQAGRMAEL